MGLIPGVGTVGWVDEPRHTWSRPWLRGANADINMTAAMAFTFALLWFYWAITENGLKAFLAHIFAPKGNFHGIMLVMMVPIFLFVGVLEVISIAIRPVALTFRLFGNIYGGEQTLEDADGAGSRSISPSCRRCRSTSWNCWSASCRRSFSPCSAPSSSSSSAITATKSIIEPFPQSDHGMTVGAAETTTQPTQQHTMFTKAFAVALAALGGGIGIGILGSKAAEATGRNPGAATPILVISIILAALIEGIFILSAFAVRSLIHPRRTRRSGACGIPLPISIFPAMITLLAVRQLKPRTPAFSKRSEDLRSQLAVFHRPGDQFLPRHLRPEEIRLRPDPGRCSSSAASASPRARRSSSASRNNSPIPKQTTAAAIAKANDEAVRLINEAKEGAHAFSEQKAQEAIAQAQQILAKAEAAAKADRDRLSTELKREFGRLVAATTAQVTGKVLTADDQKRINEDALAKVEG